MLRSHSTLLTEILERDAGFERSRATLDGWVLKVGEWLIPIVSAMRRGLINGTFIQADETPVKEQMQDDRGKKPSSVLWQHGRPGGTVVFDFRLGRGRDGPRPFLGQFEGHRGRSVGSTRQSIPNAFQGNGYDHRYARKNTKKNTIMVKQRKRRK